MYKGKYMHFTLLMRWFSYWISVWLSALNPHFSFLWNSLIYLSDPTVTRWNNPFLHVHYRLFLDWTCSRLAGGSEGLPRAFRGPFEGHTSLNPLGTLIEPPRNPHWTLTEPSLKFDQKTSLNRRFEDMAQNSKIIHTVEFIIHEIERITQLSV